jgi:hypothetical protein
MPIAAGKAVALDIGSLGLYSGRLDVLRLMRVLDSWTSKVERED